MICLSWVARATVAALAISACRPNADPPADAVAVVDGEAVSQAAFAEQVGRSLARFRGQPAPLPSGIAARLKESVLSRMIDDVILAHKAKSMKLDVSEADLEAKLAAYRARFGAPEAFDEHLQRSHTSLEGLRADMRRDMVQDRVVARLVGDFSVPADQVARYYQENLARFREPEQVRVRRLLLRLSATATPGQRRARAAQMQAWAARARRRPADFVALVRAHSEGPEKDADGDMGGFFARGTLSAELDLAVFALAPGEVTDPVTTPAGLELLQVTEHKEARVRALDEVESSLRASLTARAHNDRRREVLQQMRHAARIERRVSFDETSPSATATDISPPSAG